MSLKRASMKKTHSDDESAISLTPINPVLLSKKRKSELPVQSEGVDTVMSIFRQKTMGVKQSKIANAAPQFEEQEFFWQAEESLKTFADPGKGLSYPEQVLACEKITNSVVTPFDWSEVIQTLQNPLLETETITVQIVHANCRPLKFLRDTSLGKDLMETCDKGHRLVFGRPKDTTGVKRNFCCEACNQEMYTASRPNEHWRCEECPLAVADGFDGYCKDCYSKQFIRRKLELKTMKHHFFEEYQMALNPFDESQSHLGTTIREEPNFSSRNKIAQNTTSQTQSLPFGVCKKKEDQHEDTEDLRQFALIGLWKQESDGQNHCYRQFIVKHPIMMMKRDRYKHTWKGQQDKFLHLQEFLFKSQNGKDLYFFHNKNDDAQDSSNPIFITLIDINSACNTPSEQLQAHESGLFEVPSQFSSKELTGVAKELVFNNFQCPLSAADHNMVAPLLCDNGYLAVLTDAAVICDPDTALVNSAASGERSTGQQSLPLKMTLTKKQNPKNAKKFDPCQNLIFLDLATLAVTFIVYDVCAFAGFSQKGSQQYVYALTKTGLAKVQWETMTSYPFAIDSSNYPVTKYDEFFVLTDEARVDQLLAPKQKLPSVLLQHFLEIKNKGPVTAYLHNQEQRLTILFQNQDWFTFELKEGKAQRILHHEPMNDAVQLRTADKKLLMLGYLRQERNRNTDQNDSTKRNKKWIFTAFDLQSQQPVPHLQLNELYLFNKEKFSQDFRVRIAQDLKVHDSQPVEFNLVPIMFEKTPGQDNKFLQIRIFYTSDISHSKNVLKVCAVKLSENQDKQGTQNRFNLPTTPQHVSQLNYHASYPLLMYQSPQPLSNIMHIANLSIDCPQQRINLYPYQFLQFVKTGMVVDPKLKESDETAIFFLAQHIEHRKVRLMCYRTNPWAQESDLDEICPLERLNNILIMPGEVKFPSSHALVTRQEIILLQRQTKQGSRMVLVIQYACKKQSIWYFDFKSGDAELLVKDQEKIAKALRMQAGPNNACYFVQIEADNNNHQIVMASISDSHQQRSDDESEVFLTQTIIYQQESSILAWQLRQDQVIKKDDNYAHQFFILDGEHQYKLLGDQQRKSQGVIGSRHEEKKVTVLENVDLYCSGVNFDYLCAQLYWEKFPRAILGHRMIVVPCLNDRSQSEISRYKTNFLVNSFTHYPTSYLDYLSDRQLKQRMLKQDFSIERKMTRVVLDVQHMSWIGKHFAVVCEDKRSYFQISKSPELRRIDFMNYQQQNDCVRQMKVLDTLIAVEVHNFSYLFDQRTHLLCYKQPQIKSSVISHSINGQQLVKHRNINNKKHDLYRYYSDGSSKIVCQNYLEKIRDQIKEVDKEFKQLNEKKIRKAADANKLASSIKIDKITSGVKRAVSIEAEAQQDAVVEEFINDNFVFKVQLVRPVPFISEDSRIIQAFIPQKNKRNGDEYIFDVKQKQDYLYQRDLKINVLKRVVKLDKNGQTLFAQDENPDAIFSEVYALVGDIFHALLPREEISRDTFHKLVVHTTTDYLILICNEIILFVKQSAINQANAVEDYIERLHLEPLIPVTVLNMAQLFGSDASESKELRLSNLNSNQLRKFSTSLEQKANIIQITTMTGLILWDIDQQEQIWCVSGQKRFTNYTDREFVRIQTNYTTSHGANDLTLSMQKTKMITHNSSNNLFCFPKDHLRLLGLCFTLFSEVDIQEWIYIQKKLDRKEIIKKIESHAVTADVYGMTIFQCFQNYDDLISTIKLQMEQQQLQNETTRHGFSFDHHYIRQVYYLLQLPYLEVKNALLTPPALTHKIDDFAEQIIEQKGFVYLELESVEQKRIIKRKILSYLRQKNEAALLPNHRTLIQQSLSNVKLLEQLIGLLMLSSEKNLTNVITDFNDFKRLFQISSSIIDEFLQHSFITTQMTESICNLPMSESYLTFGGDSSQYTEDQINLCIDQERKLAQSTILGRAINWLQQLSLIKKPVPKLRPVKVRIIEVNWLRENHRALFQYLSQVDDQFIFENELIKVLLLEQDYSTQICLRIMVPYFLYMWATLTYMTYYVSGERGSSGQGFFGGDGYQGFLIVFILLLTFGFLAIEFQQFRSQGKAYRTDWWNILQLTSLNASWIIIVVHCYATEEISLNLAQWATVCTSLLWFSLFYWMQLFTETSFYVLMVLQTFMDMRYFLMMLAICIALFANALLILDKTQIHRQTKCGEACDTDYERLIPETIENNSVINSFINQYLLGLGEFTYDSYTQNEASAMVWVYFILATIVTQINFFNLLITIIGDTYSKITEAKPRYALMSRTGILADFINIVQLEPKMTEHRFLYIVQQDATGLEGAQEEWAGNVNALKQVIKQSNKKLQSQIEDETANNRRAIQKIQNQLEVMHDKIDLVLGAFKRRK